MINNINEAIYNCTSVRIMCTERFMRRKALCYVREDYPTMKEFSIINCDYDTQTVTVECRSHNNKTIYIDYNF